MATDSLSDWVRNERNLPGGRPGIAAGDQWQTYDGTDWFGQQGAPGGDDRARESDATRRVRAARGRGRLQPGDPIPKSTGNLEQDLALANQIAYGGQGHMDPGYWAQAGYSRDPDYFFRKMLGMDAGGADVATSGPYAGGGGAAGGGGGASGGPLGGFGAGLDPSAAARLGYIGGLGITVDPTQNPGYQFRLQQGQQALERSAAAKGTLLTGGTAKGLARYGQDYASNEYEKAYNRALGENQLAYGRLFGEQTNRYNQLYGLAGIGQASAAGQANQNANYANQAGNLLTQQGNAAAAGTVGSANAYNQGIQNASNLAQQYYLARMYGMTPPGGGGTGGKTIYD